MGGKIEIQKLYIQQLKNWILKKQINFKRFLNLNNFSFDIKKLLLKKKFENKIKKKKKKVCCGSLRFLPQILSVYIKYFPMPWDENSQIMGLVHKTGISFILKKKKPINEVLFFSHWNIWWFLTQKEKISKKNFIRIKFPIYDDTEKTTDFEYSSKMDTKRRKNFSKGQNFWYSQNSKDLFFSKNTFLPTFLENSSYNSVIFDFCLLFHFKKIQIFTGLEISNFKNKILGNITNSFRKILFSKKKDRKFYKKFFLSAPMKEKLTRGGGFRLFFLPFNRKIIINIENFVSLGYIKSRTSWNFEFLKKANNRITKQKENPNISYFSGEKKTRSFPLDEHFRPIFFDFFFCEKRVLFFLKNHIEETQTLKISIPLKWPHMIPLFRKLIFGINHSKKSKALSSFSYLLKNFFLRSSVELKNNGQKKNIFFKTLEKNSFFRKIDSSWTCFGIQICSQSHEMLNFLMGRKNLSFLNLDFNFNLKPTKTLSTKERKKSRFSNSFHLLREILRLTKLLIDSHLKFQSGAINLYQLSDAIHYIFTHVGHLTGIYRYKYKVMKQIKICKSIKRVLYEKFNQKTKKKGPGFGFWGPVWKIWIFFLRGTVPILERWLSNLLSRHFFGRKTLKKPVEMSTQRTEAFFDIGIRQKISEEALFLLKNNKKSIFPKTILGLFDEAWRSWKSSIFWGESNISKKIKNLIFKFIKIKADWWVKSTFKQRENIVKGKISEKNLIKKNLGRLTRLWFKKEKKKQLDFLERGPFISRRETFLVHEVFLRWIETVNQGKIPFPSFSSKSDLKLLILALENLNELKDPEKTLEFFFKNPFLTLGKIKEKILTKKIFSEIGIDFMDNFSNLIPVFKIEINDNLIDTFLDHYLWYCSLKNFLFPPWIKPVDKEIITLNVFKTCSSLCQFLDYDINSTVRKGFFFQSKIIDSFEKLDLNFLMILLKEIMNPFLANYIINRFNSELNHKNIKFINSFGIIKGLKFSGFVIQVYLFLIDLLFLGNKNALFLKSINSQKNPNKKLLESENEIYFYSRYLTDLVFCHKEENYTRSEFGFKKNLKEQKLKKLDSENNDDKDFLTSTILGKLKKRIPISFGKILIKKNLLDIKHFSKQKVTFFFEISNFQIEIRPFFEEKKLGQINFSVLKKKIFNNLFYLSGSKNVINKFENRIRQLILSSNSATFSKITNRWNSVLLGMILFLREGFRKNDNLKNIVLKSEDKIQLRIKIAFNSKMPSRFPPVLFYSPKELGGLGMLSISGFRISKNDLKFCDKRNENKRIPSLDRYFLTWKEEFCDSKFVWKEYLKRRLSKGRNKSEILFEDIEDLLDRGIPRINTLFEKNRRLLAFDHGWRIRGDFKKYQKIGLDPFWWINEVHDGKLWNLKTYRIHALDIMGGIENVLEHTLFKGTFFHSWEGLFWEKTTALAENFQSKRLTKAQKGGLSQIPNRRFTLWWSPTINRADVYVGFQVQLDLTGIFMHGKIPSLKISLIQIFRGHLWQKIHQSLVLSICQKLEENSEFLNIQTVQKEHVHPRKAYMKNSSCSDISLFSHQLWPVCNPSPLYGFRDNYKLNVLKSDKFWIDIQLRWGDFDSHDIVRYSRSKFFDFTADKNCVYPSKFGIIISIDLVYNISSAFGHWFFGLKFIIENELLKIIKSNPSLSILRERIKKSLSLYELETKDSFLNFSDFHNSFENDKIFIIDDTNFYRVGLQRTKDGNLVTRPINGALFIFQPQSGKLNLKISHPILWKGRTRLVQYSRWKAGEDVNIFLNSIPKNDRPNILISVRKALIDSIRINAVSNNEIIINGTEIRFYLQSLLKIKKLGKKVFTAKCPKISSHFLYDDWSNSITNFTSFSRVILILNSIENDFELVKNILGNFSVESNKGFWPKYTDGKWVKIEILLRDLIVENFCKTHEINSEYLTEIEIKNIIFGIDISKKIRVEHDNFLSERQTKTFKLTDRLGRKILTSNRKKIKIKKSVLMGMWKAKSIFFLNIERNLVPVIIKIDTAREKNASFIFPRNLLKYFLKFTDPGINIFSFLFGKTLNPKGPFHEIRILVIPPQSFQKKNMKISLSLPKVLILKENEFLGIFRTSYRKTFSLEKKDLFFYKTFIRKNAFLNVKNPIAAILTFLDLKSYLVAFSLEEKPEKFLKQNEKFYPIIILTENFFGFFLYPKKEESSKLQISGSHDKKLKYYFSKGYPNFFFDFEKK